MENGEKKEMGVGYIVTRTGRKIYPLEFKKKVLSELDSGKSAAEVSREYQVPIRYFQEWRMTVIKGASVALKSNEEVIPISEYKKILEEKKKLERALGKMTLERDILKDAVEIAHKKKWI